MKRFIASACVLFAWCAFGQFDAQRSGFEDGALVASGGGALFNPTNTVIGADFWWEPSTAAYVTNSGVPHLPNLGVALSKYDFTNNGAASTFPIQGPTLNSLRTLDFDGTSQWLWNYAITNVSTSPMEWVLVMNLTNNAASSVILSSQTGDVDVENNSHVVGINIGNGAVGSVQLNTNRWMVMDILVNGNSSTIWTNQVQGAVTSGQGSGTWDGTGLMAVSAVFATKGDIAMACLITNGTFGASTWSTPRSNLWFYCTNRFGPPQ